MMETEKFEHLQWAITSRSRNQQSCLKLLKLLEEHTSYWKTIRNAMIAQDLIAVAFSLWRAAFLADKTGKRSDVLSHGKMFLETVVRDNAIGFSQDKRSQEWTFNFYTRNARYALEHLYKMQPKVVPEYKSGTRTPKLRWEYCQKLLDETLSKYQDILDVRVAQSQARKAKRSAKAKKNAQRKIVRELKEADRAKK